MPNDTSAVCDPAEPISCRPSNDWWGMIGLAFFFGFTSGLVLVLLSIPPPANPALQNIFFGGLCATCLLAGILMTWWKLHARMIADTEGLRWRGFLGWKSAGWADIQDYYDRIPEQSKMRNSARAVIQTSAGNLSFGSQWTRMEAFREQVAQRATKAIVEQWDVLGSRPSDSWPQAFHYDTWSNRWMTLIFSGLLIGYLALALFQPILRAVSRFGTTEWSVTLAMLGVLTILVFSKGMLFLLLISRYQEARGRKAERITTSLEGILFEDGTRKVEADWGDVTGYGKAYGRTALQFRYAVETGHGNFEFLTEISQALLLIVIIQRYAKNSVDRKWHLRDNLAALGGEAARWSNGQVGVGAHIYHYRTRMHRALLWLPAALCLTMLFLAILSGQGLPLGGSLAYFFSVAGTMGLVFFGGWYAYRTCRIETNEEGLTRIMPLGRRRLLWSQVERYELTREGVGIAEGRGERLRFGKEIVGYEELQAEIARRVTLGKENRVGD